MKRRQFNVLVILSLLIAVVLAVLFLWQEHFDTMKTINHEKIANYFLILGIAIAFLTLIEMQRSRKLINLPDLVIHPFDIIVQKTEENFVGFYKRKDDEHGIVIDEDATPFIHVENIGTGVAKNIFFTWDYNLQELQEVLKKVILFSPIDEKDDDEQVDFLHAKAKYNLRPPYDYLHCCVPELNPFPDLINRWPPKPKLNLKVRYEDIDGGLYIKQFKVEIRAAQEYAWMGFNKK